MKRWVPWCLLVTVVGCGTAETLSLSPGCAVTEVAGGFRVECPGRAPFVLENGRDGKDGADGKSGHAAVVAQLPAGDACPAGGIVLLTAVDTNDNLALDAGDAHWQSATLCSGLPAPASPFTPVAIVDPCGPAPGVLDEVFFRLGNGRLVASYSDDAQGMNTRFALLEPGTYVTTDGDQCVFTVDASDAVVNESHHYDP